jgi:single-stranded-DNA-specific exonuclease
MAAGLSLATENLEMFQNRFDDVVGERLTPQDLIPELAIDRELEFQEISDRLIDEIESLAPFGNANPEPVFMSRNVSVASSKIVGSNHRRMVLTQTRNSNAKKINAIHFNVNTERPQKDTFDKIAFKIRWNRWRGNKTAQLDIEDTR